MSTISIESMDVKADSPLDLSDGEKNQKQLQSPEGTIVKRLFFALKKSIFCQCCAEKIRRNKQECFASCSYAFKSVRTTLKKEVDETIKEN